MHSGVHACDAMETEASGQRTDAIRGKPGARNWTEVPHYNAEIERLFSLWEAPAASCQGGKLVCAISTFLAVAIELAAGQVPTPNSHDPTSKSQLPSSKCTKTTNDHN